jgi:hypothetical protein
LGWCKKELTVANGPKIGPHLLSQNVVKTLSFLPNNVGAEQQSFFEEYSDVEDDEDLFSEKAAKKGSPKKINSKINSSIENKAEANEISSNSTTQSQLNLSAVETQLDSLAPPLNYSQQSPKGSIVISISNDTTNQESEVARDNQIAKFSESQLNSLSMTPLPNVSQITTDLAKASKTSVDISLTNDSIINREMIDLTHDKQTAEFAEPQPLNHSALHSPSATQYLLNNLDIIQKQSDTIDGVNLTHSHNHTCPCDDHPDNQNIEDEVELDINVDCTDADFTISVHLTDFEVGFNVMNLNIEGADTILSCGVECKCFWKRNGETKDYVFIQALKPVGSDNLVILYTKGHELKKWLDTPGK